MPAPVRVENRVVYPRNRQTAINALAHAQYACEINPTHLTFIRKHTGMPYTEPHHIVPISQQDRFAVSLDVEENIVSLCSNCHNHIHYGVETDALIRTLFRQRKALLHSVGIDVTEEELLSFYR